MIKPVSYEERTTHSLNMIDAYITRDAVATTFLKCTLGAFAISLVPTAMNIGYTTKYADISTGLMLASCCFAAAKMFFGGKVQNYAVSANNYAILASKPADDHLKNQVLILEKGNEYLNKYQTTAIFSVLLLGTTGVSLSINEFAVVKRYWMTAALATTTVISGLITKLFYNKLLKLSVDAKQNGIQYDHFSFLNLVMASGNT